MRYREFSPMPALSNYARHLWFFWKRGSEPDFDSDFILPEADSYLIFLLRGQYLVQGAIRDVGLTGVIAVAGCRRAVHVECPGEILMVGVRLKPTAATELSLFDPSAMSGPLAYSEPWAVEALNEARGLVSMSGESSGLDMTCVVACVAGAVARRAEMASAATARSATAWDPVEKALERTSFRAGVDELAETVGLSARQFERVCRDCTGMSPIEFRNARRCEAAANALFASERPILADLACASGFCDQAHFCRVFKAWSGMPPRRFHAACAVYRATMRGPDAMRYRESLGRRLWRGPGLDAEPPNVPPRGEDALGLRGV